MGRTNIPAQHLMDFHVADPHGVRRLRSRLHSAIHGVYYVRDYPSAAATVREGATHRVPEGSASLQGGRSRAAVITVKFRLSNVQNIVNISVLVDSETWFDCHAEHTEQSVLVGP